MIINAFMPFCFFAQTPLLSISPSTFSTTALMLPASSLERHYSPSPFRALVSRRYSNEHHHHRCSTPLVCRFAGFQYKSPFPGLQTSSIGF